MTAPRTFRRWGESDAPCRGCPDRCVGCHGQEANGLYKCERYGAFVAALTLQKRQRKDWIDADDALSDVRRKRRR